MELPRTLELQYDESGARFGTATAWARELGFSNSHPIIEHLKKLAIKPEPYDRVTHLGEAIPLWHESALVELIQRQKRHGEKVIWGALPIDSDEQNSDLSEQQSEISSKKWTARQWEYAFKFSNRYLAKRMDEIGITRPLPGTTETYDAHTVLAAMENWENQFETAPRLMPDPEHGTVLGSVQVWADTLGIHRNEMGKLLTEGGQTPRRVRERHKAKLFTEQQVRESAPDLFTASAWLARQPGVVILPWEQSIRYCTVATNIKKVMVRDRIQPIVAFSTLGKPVRYYPESAVRRHRNESSPVPVSPSEYLRTVAKTSVTPYNLELLDRIRAQATLFFGQGVQVLDSSGYIYAPSGAVLAPRSVILSQMNQEQDVEQKAVDFSAFATAEPVAIADVAWPGHWGGKARLWLYDVRALAALTSNNELQQRMYSSIAPIREYESSPSQVEVQSPCIEMTLLDQREDLDHEREGVLFGEAGLMAEEQRRLEDVRVAIKQLALTVDDERLAPLERCKWRFELLSKLDLAPADLPFTNTSDEHLYEFNGERFGTPARWAAEYGELLPPKLYKTLIILAKDAQITYHETLDQWDVYAERDILRIILGKIRG